MKTSKIILKYKNIMKTILFRYILEKYETFNESFSEFVIFYSCKLNLRKPGFNIESDHRV